MNPKNINNHQDTIESNFKSFIIKQKHPCIMARTVFKMENYTLKVYDSMHTTDVVKKILVDLITYLAAYDFESNEFESFIACFENDHFINEIEFEQALWALLQQLHEEDTKPWDHRVSNNPSDHQFSFSLGGRAFFIVGMHPKSSRMSRRSPYPTIVFNLHWQFEKLRDMGAYKTVQKRIRKRDKKLQGTINPVLRDFGTDTEAKQYSGRNVEPGWKCPFALKNNIK